MLKGILSISGQAGLFKLVAEAKSNIIVESLETGKRIPVHSTSKVSSLEDIAIYSDNGDVPLIEVFKMISKNKNGGIVISSKASSNELKVYFETIFPEYDKSRVYVSDIKKVISWYNILHEKNLLIFPEDTETEKPEPEPGN